MQDLSFTEQERAEALKFLGKRFYINPDPLTHLRLLQWAYITSASKTARAETILQRVLQTSTEFDKDLAEYAALTEMTQSQIAEQAIIKAMGNGFKENWEQTESGLFVRKA